MFGKLSLDLIPKDPVNFAAGVGMIVLAILILLAITFFRKWGYLWSQWLTTVDHKRIAIMYFIGATIMLLRGFADALLMRLHLAVNSGYGTGFLMPEHYNQIFTAHGVILIFFMAMPFMFGLFNLAVPLQIGARDMAFPFLNAVSFWMFVVGAILINMSLVYGGFAETGWLAYVPLSGGEHSPGVGVDYYIWAIQISGIGSLLSAINFFVTIIKMRAPGMTLMRMPIFTWTVLCSCILMLIIFPVLTVALGMLFLDRYFDMKFFTAGFGGNQMHYVNLVWIWGHPEVYVLVLPAFGIFSEVVATFCKKRIFGYTTMVYAIACITILSFIVWLHHFFTMGSGANVNAFFGIATMIIAVPTGVKIFNWLFTMYKGSITLTSPMYFTIAFLLTFTLGGMTGVLLSIPAVDFQLHNTLFLVAHFHNTIVGGVVFGFFAGFIYWFPKMFGFKLHEGLMKLSAVLWTLGFFVSFMPVYILGFMGMPRRLSYYDPSFGWKPFLLVALLGVFIIAAAVVAQVLSVLIAIVKRKQLAVGGDPWDGRTLEWSISSPAPSFNFVKTPVVDSIDQFWEDKQRAKKSGSVKAPEYSDIHMPRNTGVPIILSGFWFIIGFSLIFHITWLAVVGLAGVICCLIYRSFDYDTDYYMKAADVEKEMKKIKETHHE